VAQDALKDAPLVSVHPCTGGVSTGAEHCPVWMEEVELQVHLRAIVVALWLRQAALGQGRTLGGEVARDILQSQISGVIRTVVEPVVCAEVTLEPCPKLHCREWKVQEKIGKEEAELRGAAIRSDRLTNGVFSLADILEQAQSGSRFMVGLIAVAVNSTEVLKA